MVIVEIAASNSQLAEPRRSAIGRRLNQDLWPLAKVDNDLRADDYLFFDEPFVFLQLPLKDKRFRLRSDSPVYLGDHVRTADPVGLVEIRGRPSRWMIRMRVIEADDVLFAIAGIALGANQFDRINGIPVVLRALACVDAPYDRQHHVRVARECAQQNAARLVGIGFLAVPADLLVLGNSDSQHLNDWPAFTEDEI